MISGTTLLVRVDGGMRVGMGHLMRSLALAGALESRGIEAALLIREAPELTKLMERTPITAIVIPKELPENQEAAFAAEIKSTIGCEALVFDLPGDLTSEAFKAYSALGIPIALFDDHGPARDGAAAVINGIAHPEHLTGTGARKNSFDGPDYIILDPGFTESGPCEMRGEVTRVLAAMGGSDPFNITLKAAEAMLGLPEGIELHVLLGPAYQGSEELSRRLEGRRPVQVHDGVQDVPRFLAGFDLGILSFGLTAYGAARLGLPTLLLAHDDTNAAAAETYARLFGCAEFLGRHNQVGPEKIIEATQRLIENAARRKEMSELGRKAVDGKGLERVAGIIADLMR
jgi:UDP-2,4-diacetamido-2,4,6-trideoxy-beta-L-altropyranose hydrolase